MYYECKILVFRPAAFSSFPLQQQLGKVVWHNARADLTHQHLSADLDKWLGEQLSLWKTLSKTFDCCEIIVVCGIVEGLCVCRRGRLKGLFK